MVTADGDLALMVVNEAEPESCTVPIINRSAGGMMGSGADFLAGLGALLLLSLATDFLGRWTFLPRVTLLLLMGIGIGEQGLQVIPDSLTDQFDIITEMALLMVGFLLGGKLTYKMLSTQGFQLLWISLFAAVGAAAVVAFALVLVGTPFRLAVVLGCVAAATAPAATLDVVSESGRSTPFSRLLLGIVAIDDIWALVLLSLAMAFLSVSGSAMSGNALTHAGIEVGGAIALGLMIGLPGAYLTGRVRPCQPMMIEALGLVFLCGGVALWLNVSFIIASMVMGATIANLARHHDYPFHEIESIEWPFMVVFFVLAGASLQIDAIAQLGWIGAVYLVARTIGKIVGAALGAKLGGADKAVTRWMGVALLPQAGVAIGMALLASAQFPEHSQLILSVVTGTTIVFEIFGPIGARVALKRAGKPS
ncbi:MAG: cation:proton antiporter [Burkholderiaceae bacterium]